MIQHKRADINLLLGALLLFSIIIGLLHSTHIAAQEAAATEATSNTDESLERVQPLIETDSLEKTVEALGNPPLDTIVPVITGILENKKSTFDRDDRIELLLGIAAGYKTPKERNVILDFVIDHRFPELRTGDPILYIAALSSYPKAIPIVKEWYFKRVAKQSNRDELREKLETNAIDHAIGKKDITALNMMKNHGVSMTKERMSKALHGAVQKKAGRDILAFLIDQGADVNYVVAGHTPLMRAIKANDLDDVQLLVERGADTNIIADKAVGSAMQLAGEGEFAAIEEYLTEHGAQHTELH